MKILIVDDEANIRRTLSYCLTAEGYSVTAVSNAADAVLEGQRRSFDMIFLDLRLGADDGLDLIPKLLADSPWVKIIVVTAFASIETAVEAMRRGAADYIAKPFGSEQIKLLASRVARMRKLETEIAGLKEDVQRLAPEAAFQSQNPSMLRLMEMARRAAGADAIVLLRGESGTGKSVFARVFHRASSRATRPIAVVSCPAVPPDLLESELFGHARGAFTGAVRDHPGRIAACEGGTLFLDEIADMAPPVQAKLLRFIQDKEYERLGETASRQADVRILAATSADLEKRVAEGVFREDLFHRLNVISLTLPPLKQRPEDILPLAESFLAHFARVNHRTILGFTDEAAAALAAHSWPGNVRELRNVIERAVILGSGERIDAPDLPGAVAPGTAPPAIGDRVPLATIEELHIRRVLASTGSLQEAADILGIDQATLWRRRKTYGI
jgi:NtrC-family two-component system response regulator AlgB